MNSTPSNERPCDQGQNPTTKAVYGDCPPWEICNTWPCRHTPCQDVDWLASLEEGSLYPEFHRKAWWYFQYPSLLEGVPSEEAEKYRATFDRCQRLLDKTESIRDEIRVNRLRMRREWGVPLPDLEYLKTLDIDALKKELAEKITFLFKSDEKLQKMRRYRRALAGTGS